MQDRYLHGFVVCALLPEPNPLANGPYGRPRINKEVFSSRKRVRIAGKRDGMLAVDDDAERLGHKADEMHRSPDAVCLCDGKASHGTRFANVRVYHHDVAFRYANVLRSMSTLLRVAGYLKRATPLY